jgi:hypothetical protein
MSERDCNTCVHEPLGLSEEPCRECWDNITMMGVTFTLWKASTTIVPQRYVFDSEAAAVVHGTLIGNAQAVEDELNRGDVEAARRILRRALEEVGR